MPPIWGQQRFCDAFPLLRSSLLARLYGVQDATNVGAFGLEQSRKPSAFVVESHSLHLHQSMLQCLLGNGRRSAGPLRWNERRRRSAAHHRSSSLGNRSGKLLSLSSSSLEIKYK